VCVTAEAGMLIPLSKKSCCTLVFDTDKPEGSLACLIFPHLLIISNSVLKLALTKRK
jgi:hypothetical protein